jgi:periplasmic copper chaperone A
MIRSLQAMLLCLSAALPSGGAAQGHTAPAGGLVVRDAWVRESTASRTTSSGYFTIDNRTDTSVALVRVALEGVRNAQMHAVVEQQGQAGMRSLATISIPARGSVSLVPGGAHVMLIEVARPLRPGTSVEMTLTFDNKQTRRVRAVVRPMSAMSAR